MNVLFRIVAAVMVASFSYGASAQLPGRSASALDAYAQIQGAGAPAKVDCRQVFRHQIVDKGWGYYYCVAQNDPQRFIHCRELALEYGSDFAQPGFMRGPISRCMRHEEWRDRHLAEAAALAK